MVKLIRDAGFSLSENELLERNGLSLNETRRYSRHLVLHEVGPNGQLRLKHSSALVVGLGGLGVPAAVQLVSAGVGRVGIADSDKVEMSNLQRQFIFSKNDLEQRKVDAAREKLGSVNPEVKVTTHPVRLDASNATELIQEYDLVIDATDNLPSRYLINDVCVLLGKPDVYASVLGFDGQVSVFKTPEGPCYRCLFPEPPLPESLKSCEQAGVLNTVANITGSIQANQAISILLGKGTPLIGRLLTFDGLDNSFDEIRFNKNPSCAICGPNPTITKLIDYEKFCGIQSDESNVESDITVVELKEIIDSGKHPALIDVREPSEYSMCHLDSSVLIPLDQLSARLDELHKDREIIVYCHIGIRSASAVMLLRESGFTKARNLLGGIDEWARQIDPNMVRY